MTEPIAQLLQRSDALRRASRWTEAREGYERALPKALNDPVVAHNLALCHLALGDHQAAVTHSTRALHLSPGLWQSGMVQAKALAALGQRDAVLSLLRQLHQSQPANGDIALELARLLLQHGGDAAQATALARPWLDNGLHKDAQIVMLLAQLYEPEPGTTADSLSTGLKAFADAHLQLSPDTISEPATAVTAKPQIRANRRAKPPRRIKVGLLSPQFTVSPVYFFTFGVLTRLANTVDLAFVSRGTKTDWATRSFRSIAHDWIDVPSHTSEQLAVTLANRDLDVMIDLGGWMDPVGLQALSLKPVRKQFKWVGGQSATTGLRSFDGYFTDRYQTPRGTDHLYSEPLIRLKSGYVTYTPPPYLPKPTLAPRRGTVALGVIANPAKISQAFLTDLRERLPGWNAQVQRSGRVLELRFIEQRYRQAQIRARIEAVLAPAGWSAPKPEFILPTTHLEYLTAVSELDAIIDTWPYSGGLTTIEGLAMGVPTYTRAGMLFCERHTASHCAYAGMSLRSVALEHFNGMPKHLRSGRSLITADSPRVNHDALAEELLAYLRA